MPIAMNLFYNDDSALDPNKHTFFVYGGIEIPEENVLWLRDAIERLKTKHDLKPDQPLKYNPTPEGMTKESFNDLKAGIISAAS